MFRIDLDGKVKGTLNETLKSIIRQNYLSSDGDDVSLNMYILMFYYHKIFEIQTLG